MKKNILAVALLAFCATGFTACKPSKSQMKDAIVKQCNEEAGKQINDPKQLSYMKEYCECSGEKASEKLTIEEFEEINKMQKEGRQAEMKAKLMPVVQPCLDDMAEKMQKNNAGG